MTQFPAAVHHLALTVTDTGQRFDELGIEHGGINADGLGYGLSFRDPDQIALEFWAPRP